MLKASHFFIKIATLFVAVVYLFLAVYLAAGYYFINRLPDYKSDIEAFLNNETGLVWNIENLQGHFQRYNPVFHFEKLDVYDDQERLSTPIKLSHAQIQINLLATLFHRQLIIKEVRAENFSINFVKKNGRWSIEGMRQGHSSGYSLDDVELLLENLYAINIGRIDVSLKDDGEILTLPEMTLELRSSRTNRHLIFQNKSLDDQKIKLAVDFDKLSFKQDSVFSAYLQTEHFFSNDWLGFMVENWSFENWTGELWFEKKTNQGVDFIASVDSGAVVQRHSDNWSLSEIQSDFAGHIDLQGEVGLWWQFGQAMWNQREIALPAAQLSLHRNQGLLTHIVLQAETIDVAYLNEMLLHSGVLFDELTETLSTLSPSGLLDDMYLYLPINQDSEKFKFNAALRGININPWKNVPGGENISGYIESSLKNGFVQLNSIDSFSMEFPNIYAQSLQFDSAQGRVDWSIADGFKVAANDISIMLGDEELFASFYIESAAKKSEEAGYMNLSIGAKNTKAETLLQYVPKTLNTDLLAWIKKGKLSGGVDEGGFIFNGPLRKGHADKKNVLLYLKLADTNLFFDPNWPRLESVHGLLTVNNNEAMAEIEQSNFSGLTISDTTVNVGFSQAEQMLTVSSDVNGSLSNALTVLKSPALKDKIGDVVKDWESTVGVVSNGQLSLQMPLSKNNKNIDIKFLSQIEGADLILNNMDLHVKNISGPIEYSSAAGLISKRIVADVWGEAVEISLGDFSKNDFDIDIDSVSDSFRVDIKGEFLLGKIGEWLELPIFGYLEGRSNFHTQINVLDSQTYIIAQSDLDKVSFLLPDSLKSILNKEKQFRMDWFINQKTQPMVLNLSSVIASEFYFDKFSFLGGRVSLKPFTTQEAFSDFSKDAWSEKNHRKIVIEGSLEALELDDVLQVLDQYEVYTQPFAHIVSRDQSSIEISISDFDINQAAAFGQTIKQINLSMESYPEAFKFLLHSDKLVGSIVVPRAASSKQESIIEDSMNFQRPYELDLKYLKVDFSEDNTTESQVEPLLPSAFPALSAEIDRLDFNEKALAAVNFNTFLKGEAFVVSDFSAEMQDILISSQDNALEWSLNSNGEQLSQLNLQLEGKNIELFIETFLGSSLDSDLNSASSSDLNIGNDSAIKSPIKSEKTFLDLSFSWDGMPADFSLSELNGQMQFNLEKGQFLNSSSSTNNVLKLIGLVNFDTMFRRLQLDFSDLYGEGLAFDSAEGRLLFQNKKVSFQEFPIHVKGPSSEFFLNGVADLDSSTIDADLILTLPVAKSLPWIVALAGGLPAAAGTYVATKLFENEVKKLSTARYKVSGSLDEPDLVFDKLFETKSEKVKSDKPGGEEATNKASNDSVAEQSEASQLEESQ